MWVKLYGVPVMAFSEDSLSAIATKLGVPVGPKVRFKPHKEYRPVPKKHDASSSGNKKICVETTIEVSNSNPFYVLNSVDNDVELGTNRGTINLVDNEANSSGSSFMNVELPGDYDSEDEVASVYNDMARSLDSERDVSQEIQAICDNLDIRVRGREKK
nr:hypothetical protein [Tanacetum cinerariifolium]